MWTRVTALLVNKIHGISTLPENSEMAMVCKFLQKQDKSGQDCGFIQVNCKNWYSINHRGTFIPYIDTASKIIYKNDVYYNTLTGSPIKTTFIRPNDATILLVEQMKTHVDVVVHDDIVVFPSHNCEGEFIAYSDCGNVNDIKFATDYGMTQTNAVNYHNPEKLKWTMDQKEMTLTTDGHVFELPPIANKCNTFDVYKCGDIYVFLADSYYIRFIGDKKCISNAEILKKKDVIQSLDNNKSETGSIRRYQGYRRQRRLTYNYGNDKERGSCVRY